MADAKDSPLGIFGVMIFVSIMYDWTIFDILITLIKSNKDETMVKYFKDSIEYLSKWRFISMFNIIDNNPSKATREFLQSKDIKLQLTEPNNYRVNSTEHVS